MRQLNREQLLEFNRNRDFLQLGLRFRLQLNGSFLMTLWVLSSADTGLQMLGRDMVQLSQFKFCVVAEVLTPWWWSHFCSA